MKLSEIAILVEDKISSNSISLGDYITTESLLPNKEGKGVATNLPPVVCSLTHFREGDVLVANIRPYLKKVWFADKEGGCSSDVLVFRAKEGCKSSFLYAVLLQDNFFDHTMKGVKGSKMPRGDKGQIMRYELPIFSLQEQENIGNFVINIMKKIMLNRSINHNLRARREQRRTVFSLCRADAVNGDVIRNFVENARHRLSPVHSSKGEEVSHVA